MTESNRYDVLIIGAGQAGIPLAHDLAKAGKRVALAEEKFLGGSCVNFGCTPTKAVIASARVAHLARRGKEFGLKIPTVEVDFPAVLERARRILIESRNRLQQDFEKTDNPKLLRGSARLEGREKDAFRVAIGNQVLVAEQVVLDTGTRSAIPPIEGLDAVDFICAENWLESIELPEHLAIIGGGYIGLEMSQFYRRMGSRVTVIEEADQVAGHEDRDVASALQRLLEAEGIEFRLNSRVKRVDNHHGSTKITIAKDNQSLAIEASHVFVATGRTPNTEDLGLETVGVRVSDRGIVEANQRLATNVEGIWVAGDIRGGPMFTHTSWDDYRILLSQIAGDGSRTTDRVVPYAIFTDPQLGRVGMTEPEAQNSGKEIKIARYEMKSNGRAREFGESEGFIKVIADRKTNRILGAAVLASEGAELVHLYVDLMNADDPYTLIRDAIYIHPTLAEAIQSATASWTRRETKGATMPEKETLERAKKDKREGKAASTQAGEFVREEIEHVREGKHGARSAKQAIAIGLSKARRAGVKLPAKKGTSKKTQKQAARDIRKGKSASKGKKSAKRSRATLGALKREGHSAASKKALSRQARSAAAKRSAASRSRAAKKAAATRKK